MPIYNASLPEFQSAIESVRGYGAQIIVVNDGSRGDLANSYKEYLDSIDEECIFTSLNKNRGSMYARCMGIEMATNDYIVFLDSDDKLAPRTIDLVDEILVRKSVRHHPVIVYYLHDCDDGSIFKTPPEGFYSAASARHIFYSGKTIQTYPTYAIETKFAKECNDDLLELCKDTKICLGDDRLMMIEYMHRMNEYKDAGMYILPEGLYIYGDPRTSGKLDLDEESYIKLYRDKMAPVRKAIRTLYWWFMTQKSGFYDYSEYDVAFPQIFISICNIPKDRIPKKVKEMILEEFGQEVVDRYNEENNYRLKI